MTMTKTSPYNHQTLGDLYAEYRSEAKVNHPLHYTQGNVECIDALAAATVNKKGIEAVCVANIIKYLWRYETKNGIEDVKKAKWYIDKLLEEMKC